MTEKHYPEQNRQPESEYNQHENPNPAKRQTENDLSLWGAEPEEEITHYGDLRDQSFQADSGTSEPGSMSEETPQHEGWIAQDAPREEYDHDYDENDETVRDRESIRQPNHNRTQ